MTSPRRSQNKTFFFDIFHKFLRYFGSILSASDASHIEEMKNFGRDIYMYAHDHGMLVGRSREAFAYAALYVSCEECGIPIQMKDYDAKLPEMLSRIRIAIKLIREKILPNLEKPVLSYNIYENIIQRYADDLGFTEKHKGYAYAIVQFFLDNNIIGKGIVPTACYIAGNTEIDGVNPHVTQSTISDLFGVSMVTIRSYISKVRNIVRDSDIFTYNFFRKFITSEG